ncbi:MAG TPA: DUF721 domain-containing protein [Patescibacteria group bacterium]
MLHINKILKNSIKKSGLEPQIEASLVLEEAGQILYAIFGDKIVNQARPLYVKNKILTIAVLSSIVSQELKLRESEIIDKINKKFEKNLVARLRFAA